MPNKRIFLACADKRLKVALHMLLDNEPDMIVAGMSDRLDGLTRQLDASQPDVLVLEGQGPLPRMAEKLTEIRKLTCPPVIIYLSNKVAEKEEILGSGVDYFVIKDSPPDALLTILNHIRIPDREELHQKSLKGGQEEVSTIVTK